MKITTYKPRTSILNKYIAFYYSTVLKDVTYYAYPHYNLPSSFCKNTLLTSDGDTSYMVADAAPGNNFKVFNRFKKPVKIVVKGSVEEFCVIFKPYGLAQFVTSLEPYKACGNAKMFTIFPDFIEANPNFFELDIAARITCIEAYLCQKLIEKPGTDIVVKAFELMQNPELSVVQLANACCCSSKKLSRLFYKLCGESPVTYKRIVSFRAALDRMQQENPHMQLADIAFSSGYCDLPYFTNSFKKLTGETPGAFFSNVNAYTNQNIYFKKVKNS